MPPMEQCLDNWIFKEMQDMVKNTKFDAVLAMPTTSASYAQVFNCSYIAFSPAGDLLIKRYHK